MHAALILGWCFVGTYQIQPGTPVLPVTLADEQEPLPPPAAGRATQDFGLNAGIHGRFSMPFGPAHRDEAFISGPGGAVVVIDQHLSWNEVFNPGWGAELEVDVYIASEGGSAFGRGGGRMRYGGYIILSMDTYEGESVSEGSFKMAMSDLDMTMIIAGGKVETPLGNKFFGDARAGIGVVHYSAVDATISGPLFNPFIAEFYEDTYTFAFEVRGHGGVELGPLQLVAGMGFRFLAPPDEGSSVDLSSGLFYTWDLEIGVELGF